MFLYSMLNYIFGYTLISVQRGKACEKLLGYLIREKISFWDMKNIQTRTFLKVKHFHKKQLIIASKQLGFSKDEITIINMGLPFVLLKYKIRFGMMLGVLIGIFITIYSTFFVWKIDIIGNTEYSYTEISDMLKKHGFSEGTFLPNVDLKRVETAIMAENDGIAFISIYMKGTNAKVQINERVLKGEREDLTKPKNIVASHSGQILKFEIVSGETVVKRGQAVEKGQLLVSGVIDSNAVGYRLKSASGKVFASTLHKIEYKIPLKQQVKHYTGHEIKRKSIKILGKYINFFINSGNLYTKYDTIYNEEIITLFDTIELPIYYVTTTYAEYQEYQQEIDVKRARELAYDKYAEFISSRKSIAIEKENLTEEICDGYFVLSGDIECIEDIAQEKIFYYNQEHNT